MSKTPNISHLGENQREILRQLLENSSWEITDVWDSRDMRSEANLCDEDHDNWFAFIPQKTMTSLVKRNLFTEHTIHKCIDPDIDITTYRLTGAAREQLTKLFNYDAA